jgi:phenylacetate-CoA ligase
MRGLNERHWPPVSSLAGRLYDAMPSPIQHVLCTAEGYRIHRRRFGRKFDADLREVVARTWSSNEDVLAYRDRLLEAFIGEMAETPFYGANRLATGRRAAVADFPVLDKATVQAHGSAIARPDVPSRIAHTSGSTGAGLRFPVTAAAVRQQWATWWRYRQWHGLHRGVWCAYFGGRSVVRMAQRRPPFWRYNAAGRQVFFSAYHLRPDTWREYLAELQRRRLPWLHGYPSVLALLAAYLIEHHASLGYDVRWITVGAENLLPSQAAAIERAFGVRPRQHYGMAEAVANASECPQGCLHVDEDFSFVEFVPLAAAGAYRIVGTNFTNPAFPLIRYDVGDIAYVSGRTCVCGRPGRIIDRIEGRREDYVLLPDGALIGRLDHIFKDQVRVREAQIYQPDRHRVVLRIVRRDDFTTVDEASVVREARQRLGDDVGIDVDYVDALPRTSTGKLRFVVSDVAGMMAPVVDGESGAAAGQGRPGQASAPIR